MRPLEILMKFSGIGATLVGVVFYMVGAYGLAGGTGITFYINERLVSPQEAGWIFSIVGIIILFVGIPLTYISFKPSRLTILSMGLGICSLVIPSVLLVARYNLVAGIIAVVLGYCWLATIFVWLQRGE